MPEPVVLGEVIPDMLAELTGIALAGKAASSCQQPIYLSGYQHTIDGSTGEILSTLTSDSLPGGVLSVACKTRRASRCEPCSTLYKWDAYQIAAAGLRGGKTVPDTVTTHPRLWVTLTAPSFGPVHRGPDKTGKTRPCHPRRTGPSCTRWHRADDPAIGTPIDPEGYDYTGAVLFNHHAGALWSRFTRHLRRILPRLAGVSQREFRDLASISFGKVAEYQTRGLVHFHAVIRLDGPEGPATPPPAVLATTGLLVDAIRIAHEATYVDTDVSGIPSRRLTWGDQLDIQPITDLGGGAISDTRVAGYIAKYATKGSEATGNTLDERLTCRACRGAGVHCPDCDFTCRTCAGTGIRPDLDLSDVLAHPRRMIQTCLTLDNDGLRRWAHMLGFGGHFLTKSRTYSTTFGALRAVRADHQATQARHSAGLPDTVILINHWTYTSHTPTTTTHATRKGTPPCPPTTCSPSPTS